MEITIELDAYKLDVEIIRLINDPPDPMCRDSADDFRGTREVEWRLVYATHHNEKGKIDECGQLPKWLERIADRHGAEIEAAIWARYDEQGDSDGNQ
jgi:hypothetical protein